jgi:hypothetical protein
VLTTPQEWHSYLREYSELYLRTANEYQRDALEPEQAATRWMGSEPATEEAGRPSNGLVSNSLRAFAASCWPAMGGAVSAAGSPCERISWMRDTPGGESVIDIYSENSDEDDEYVTLFQRSLDVAERRRLLVARPH